MCIYGSTPGKNVAAKSTLVLELTQHLIFKAMNLRSECKFPDDLTDFEACNGESEIVLNSDQYSLSFGEKSEMDTSTEELYKKYSDKFKNEENAKSYFDMLSIYQDDISKLDEPIIWETVIHIE